MIFFSPEDKRNLKRLSIDSNQQIPTGGQQPNGRMPLGAEKMVCKTTVAIPARSGDVAGSDNQVKVVQVGDDGTMFETGDFATVYNIFGTDVAADVYITIARYGGRWFVDAEDCS